MAEELKAYDPSWSEWLAGQFVNALDRVRGPDSQGDRGAYDVAQKTMGLVPGLGQVLAGNEAYRDAKSGNYLSALAEGAMALPIPGAGVLTAEAKPLVKGAVKAMTELPNLRGLPVEQAMEIAKRDPHLIPGGAGSPSAFIGGPQSVQSKRGLTNLRKNFDAYVAEDPRGGDWYDRYRRGVTSVTGGDPLENEWMSKMEGQWSAGVSPEGELGFALKENNGALTGFPTKAALPAQHEAFMNAIAANDPNLMQLGEKTGEYARQINPDQPLPPGATGVNDFRYARQWGYLDADGNPTSLSPKGPPQTFLDYETANAVRRANEANLGGRSNWTGEQLQAAPWVRQKALSLLEPRPSLGSYDDAFTEANKTIADFFPKHTAFATHEAIPGVGTGHLPGSSTASQAEREAFTADPRSSWANAPGGRDAIYSGLRLGDTGVAGRVLPTDEMTGLYVNPQGGVETNPGFVARPLVSFDSLGGGAKAMPAGDRAMLQAGETTRAYIDAQNAGAAQKLWEGGPVGSQNAFMVPMDRRASANELLALRDRMGPLGLGDVVDTGNGVIATNFEGTAPPFTAKNRAAMVAQLQGFGDPHAVTHESVYAPLAEEFAAGEGSGAATRKLIEATSVTPELRQAFNANPFISGNAADRMARDAEWEQKWGRARPDIQNARDITAKGPGWLDRLEAALKSGALLPALGGAFLLPHFLDEDAPSPQR